MHTPAYRRLYVHVPCTYELCSSAKLPSSFAEPWQRAFAVGYARDAAQRPRTEGSSEAGSSGGPAHARDEDPETNRRPGVSVE